MQETRILTVDDADALSNIYHQIEPWRSEHQPKEKFDFWKNLENVEKTLLDKSGTYIGTFQDGQLIASLRMTWWKSMPHWSLGNIVTNIRTLTINLEKNGVAAAMKLALDLAESKGYFRFYTSISERQMSQEIFDLWPKYVPELTDYLYVVEFEHDGVESTGFPAFDMLLESARLPPPYNSKYYIRSATANNSRRKLKILKDLNEH